MSQVLIRNVHPRILRRLKRRAQQHGRSLESELRCLIEEAARLESDWKDYWATVDRLRKSLEGRRHTDSADLIREDRER